MLRIETLKKTYGNFHLDVAFTLKPGRITGLVGQNGSGKTTTFKAILGLIHCDEIDMTLFNHNKKKPTAQDKEQMGVVMADSGFSEYLCIGDLISVLQSLYPCFDVAGFQKGCHDFGLDLHKRIQEFSTGMKAKLKILCALHHRANLLILDEPTAGLDVVARDDVLDLLRMYMEDHPDASILISSHISSDLETLCDDLYMIHQGHIVLHEDTDILLSEYALLKMTSKQYKDLDKQFLIKVKKEGFGYSALTNQSKFYQENYPQIVVEKGKLDEVITLMIRGE